MEFLCNIYHNIRTATEMQLIKHNRIKMKHSNIKLGEDKASLVSSDYFVFVMLSFRYYRKALV
jgi:hypothetical protein